MLSHPGPKPVLFFRWVFQPQKLGASHQGCLTSFAVRSKGMYHAPPLLNQNLYTNIIEYIITVKYRYHVLLYNYECTYSIIQLYGSVVL